MAALSVVGAGMRSTAASTCCRSWRCSPSPPGASSSLPPRARLSHRELLGDFARLGGMRLLLPLALVPPWASSACGTGEEAGSGSTVAEPEPGGGPRHRPRRLHGGRNPRGDADGRAAAGRDPRRDRQRDGRRALLLAERTGTGLGFGAPPGRPSRSSTSAPGALTVGCDDPATEPKPGEPIEIVDPEGLWVSTQLPCASSSPPSSTTSRARRARRATRSRRPARPSRTTGSSRRRLRAGRLSGGRSRPKVRLVRDGAPARGRRPRGRRQRQVAR